MYIRCLDCQSSTWLESLESVSVSRKVSCQSCGRPYKLEIPEDLGNTQRDQYQRALGFAEETGIDLPSAYSVLLGIMSLDEARGLREQSVSATAKAATARADANRVREAERAERSRRSADAIQPPPTDRSRSARIEGQISAREEFEHRNRLLLAARLASKHDLSMKLAHKVVSNRLSLHAALVERDTEKARKAARKPITSSQRLAVAVVVVLLVAAVAAYGLNTWTSLGDEARAVARLSEVASQKAAAEAEHPTDGDSTSPTADDDAENPVVTDDQGRVLAVSGPDPQSVLLRFCEASESNRLKPVELAPTVPPFPGSRLGVFRDFDRLESFFAIRIRKDRGTSRWIAGDGTRPIVAILAPEQPADAARIPVETR